MKKVTFIKVELIADDVHNKLTEAWGLSLESKHKGEEPIEDLKVLTNESIQEYIKGVKGTVKFLDDNDKEEVSRVEFVALVINRFDDGLSDLYDSLAYEDGGNICSVDGAIYLTDGMYLMPNGDIKSEDEI